MEVAGRKEARTSLDLRRLVGLLDAVRGVMNQQVGRLNVFVLCGVV